MAAKKKTTTDKEATLSPRDNVTVRLRALTPLYEDRHIAKGEVFETTAARAAALVALAEPVADTE